MAATTEAPLFSVLCMACLTVSSAFLVSSSNSVTNFSRVDLGPNLQRYIEHESRRLKIITGMEKHKEEIELIENRLSEFKQLSAALAKNATAQLRESLASQHPTSLFVAVRNYMSEFVAKYDNHTRYGDRFREFMQKEVSGPLPDRQDLHRVGMALSVIENVYQFSMDDMHKGLIAGQQGEALSSADMYDIASTMISDGLLSSAYRWIEAALSDIDLKTFKKSDATFDVVNALQILARVAFAKDDKDKALELYEKAVELDPENQQLYKDYVAHRFGRNVQKLDELDVEKVEPWRKTYFSQCRQSLSLTDDRPYHVADPAHPRLLCRYKAGHWLPYVVYKEEVLHVTPFISIIYDFLPAGEADAIKEATLPQLDHFVLPGNDRVTLWQFKGDHFKDHEWPVVKGASWKAGDVTNLKVTQKVKKSQVSYGEPVHILDYGVSGLALPHAEFKKEYHTQYMNIDNGKRYATLMVPLTDVLVGGATTFIEQNVTIKAKKGMAVLFYSYTPAGDRELTMYAATCPLAAGRNIMLEKGIWWTIYDKTNFCGKKVTSSHLARERVTSQHRRLLARQRPAFVPSQPYMDGYIAKLKAEIAERRAREAREAEEKAPKPKPKKTKKVKKSKKKSGDS